MKTTFRALLLAAVSVPVASAARDGVVVVVEDGARQVRWRQGHAGHAASASEGLLLTARGPASIVFEVRAKRSYTRRALRLVLLRDGEYAEEVSLRLVERSGGSPRQMPLVGRFGIKVPNGDHRYRLTPVRAEVAVRTKVVRRLPRAMAQPSPAVHEPGDEAAAGTVVTGEGLDFGHDPVLTNTDTDATRSDVAQNAPVDAADAISSHADDAAVEDVSSSADRDADAPVPSREAFPEQVDDIASSADADTADAAVSRETRERAVARSPEAVAQQPRDDPVGPPPEASLPPRWQASADLGFARVSSNVFARGAWGGRGHVRASRPVEPSPALAGLLSDLRVRVGLAGQRVADAPYTRTAHVLFGGSPEGPYGPNVPSGVSEYSIDVHATVHACLLRVGRVSVTPQLGMAATWSFATGAGSTAPGRGTAPKTYQRATAGILWGATARYRAQWLTVGLSLVRHSYRLLNVGGWQGALQEKLATVETGGLANTTAADVRMGRLTARDEGAVWITVPFSDRLAVRLALQASLAHGEGVVDASRATIVPLVGLAFRESP